MNKETTQDSERTHYASRLLSRMLNERKKPEHRAPVEAPAARESTAATEQKVAAPVTKV